MRTAYTAGQIRAAEHALMATLPEGTLMQRAAAGLAAACADLLGRVYGTRVVLLVGSGDNGGDALYAGERLARRGARVGAVLAGSKTHEAGLRALREAGGRVVEASAIEGADLIIDGLVGIGASGALREPYARLAERANAAGGTIVAVDVPSGVDAGSGRVEGAAVRARVTVTMGAYKTGLLVDPGASCAGRVELVDIGLAPHLPEPDATALTGGDVAALLPRPGNESDKYRRGVLGVAAGGDLFTGAAVLAVGGALRGGAGLVRYAGRAAPVAQVRAHWPEAVVTQLDEPCLDQVGRVQAWVLGPGLGTGDWAHELAAAVLGSDVPVLIDADGLTLVAKDRALLRRAAPVLITPHAGELARLIGADRADIEAARLAHARRAAAELGVTVLLKGSTTVVAEEGRPVRVNTTGTPWLATGGTGDVLSGLAGALLVQGLSCYDAASAGAFLHGLAGRLAAGGAPLAAADVATAIPAAVRALAGPASGKTALDHVPELPH
ncbi:bifunctional ADP-dependent NAD(P)H-hydrate dehydratase/NAD(P)H-hydrate epimerase [Nonomuraea candida]|uniref:bifunctional ADP-dependent NAD(P)H-hydrate dehydratase/NAD(P)H-hydrate epimerase n=1 Tax=Nonomuraea candida TaxID=359159 RepID=UPI0006948092|nr:bifunctional ADP-dependent NAD(P)H-hydrate dehydratase/NAD(P)H-hydrate epimerase [Nonomuraea candida]